VARGLHPLPGQQASLQSFPFPYFVEHACTEPTWNTLAENSEHGQLGKSQPCRAFENSCERIRKEAGADYKDNRRRAGTATVPVRVLLLANKQIDKRARCGPGLASIAIRFCPDAEVLLFLPAN